MIFETVVNVSVGDNISDFNTIYNSIISLHPLIDVHRDSDHNRSVFTIASKNLFDVIRTSHLLISKSFETLDITCHKGEHPRIGIVDVLPFIKYDENTGETNYDNDFEFKDEVINFARVLSSEFKVPIFFYDYASDGDATSLPQIRKNAFENLKPNIGENLPNKKFGAIALGIREPLVAINVNLDTDNISLAKEIASSIRESSGGYKGVRALAIELASRNCVQVSMNIIDLAKANVGEICLKVKELASQKNINSHIELVGLMPNYHYKILSQEFLEWAKLDINCVVEYHLDS